MATKQLGLSFLHIISSLYLGVIGYSIGFYWIQSILIFLACFWINLNASSCQKSWRSHTDLLFLIWKVFCMCVVVWSKVKPWKNSTIDGSNLGGYNIVNKCLNFFQCISVLNCQLFKDDSISIGLSWTRVVKSYIPFLTTSA